MTRVLVIADDLTGANDTAVQFAAGGFRAATLFDTADRHRVAAVASEVDVLAITSESRNLTPQEARARVLALTEAILSVSSPDIVYKKIDSTLRGNVSHEISAVREAGLQDLPAIASPAFPANKRYVCGGYLLVNGRPLSQTYAANDVLAPVKTSKVADYLSETPEEVGHLGLSAFESGKAAVRSQLDDLLRRGSLNVSADSMSQADLDTLAAVMVESPAKFLWVGSAGLAQSLSKVMSSGSAARSTSGRDVSMSDGNSAAAPAPGSARRHLFLMGSMNPVSVAQVEEMDEQDRAGVFYARSADDAVETSSFITDKRDFVVSTQRMRGNGPSRAIATHAKTFLAGLASKAVAGGEFTALVLSGGDVAFAALRALEATGVEVQDEVLPGIPYGKVLDGPNRGLGIVTKAGGFGSRDCLLSISQWLNQRGF